MGLGSKFIFDVNDLPDDSRGGGEGCSSVTCSICLETVVKSGDRAWAKLQCDHQFHLDCIGSAFNAKGMMQCPNCRKVEKGDWLNPNSSSSPPVYNLNDPAPLEEDVPNTPRYSVMAFGVRWCPFRNGFRPPSYENGEFPTSSHHNLVGLRGYIEPATQPSPYLAHLGSVHSSPSIIAGAGNVSDSSSFSSYWNSGSLASGEVPNTYGFPVDSLHRSWDYYLHPPPPQQNFSSYSPYTFIPPYSMGHPDAARTSGAIGSDLTRLGTPHFVRPVHGQSSSGRAGSLVASGPRIPPLRTRNRERMEALEAYYQQQSFPQTHQPELPVVTGGQVAQFELWPRGSEMGSTSASSDQAGGIGSSSFNIWERDPCMQSQQAELVDQVDREPSIWTSSFTGKFESFHQSHGGGGGEGSS